MWSTLAYMSRRNHTFGTGTKNNNRVFAQDNERNRFFSCFDSVDLDNSKVCETKSDQSFRDSFICIYCHRGAYRSRFGFNGKHGRNPDDCPSVLGNRHLINTFILLASLSITAWLASGGASLKFSGTNRKTWVFLVAGVFGILLIGSSGVLAALSSMLFPAGSLAEGIRQDFSGTSHLLIRLRISHPILSVLIGVFLVFLAGWFKSAHKEIPGVERFANLLTGFIIFQLGFGALTLLTLAPILMQLGHLFLADAVWISFVLMWTSYFGGKAGSITESTQ